MKAPAKLEITGNQLPTFHRLHPTSWIPNHPDSSPQVKSGWNKLSSQAWLTISLPWMRHPRSHVLSHTLGDGGILLGEGLGRWTFKIVTISRLYHLQHMVLPWDALVLSSSVEEAFSASVVSGDHAHVHCRFPGSWKILNPIFNI